MAMGITEPLVLGVSLPGQVGPAEKAPDCLHHLWMKLPMKLDLFASEESRHCLHWFSWTEVTSPMGKDALVHDWPDSLLMPSRHCL
ncbi:hypothetical protein NQZ68_032199 [Dissostichus eleginoides]|nr:hypothetical protein NQZ68_032199 [Dissostichus eleginoides]